MIPVHARNDINMGDKFHDISTVWYGNIIKDINKKQTLCL